MCSKIQDKNPRQKSKTKGENEMKKETKKEKSKAEVNTVELLIWNIDPTLKVKFKTSCIKNNISMREAVINFMKNYK